MRDSAREDRAPLVALNATGTRPPFFFLHGDFTGGGFFSHKLARALGDDQPFYAVHPHGLIDPAVPDSIEAMAAERLPAVRAVRPRGPYVLGGHCAGGMVALEIARQLMREGEEVCCVLMIDTVAPRPPKLVFPGVSVGADVQRPRRRSAAASPARRCARERTHALPRCDQEIRSGPVRGSRRRAASREPSRHASGNGLDRVRAGRGDAPLCQATTTR